MTDVCCASSHEPPDSACKSFLAGSRGTCVYCDHEAKCHPGPGGTCWVFQPERLADTSTGASVVSVSEVVGGRVVATTEVLPGESAGDAIFRMTDGRCGVRPESLKPKSWNRATKLERRRWTKAGLVDVLPHCSTLFCGERAVYGLRASHGRPRRASRNFCAACSARLHPSLIPEPETP